MEQLLEKLMEWGMQYGPKVIAAIAILFLGRILVGITVGIIRKVMKKGGSEDILAGFVTSLTKIGLMTFVVIAAMSSLGIQTTSLVAVLGAAGLAVGFALQGSLSNFAAGVMLIIFRPFKTGDFVEAGGTSGSVEEIGIFNTVLKTPDNKKVMVPNSNITGNNVTNYSSQETRRIDLVFGIGYDDDLRKAKKLLEQIVSEDNRVLKEPAVTVAVAELADSSVNFVVRPWVKTADYWAVLFDLTETVKLRFDDAGISIPYPQQDIHIHQTSNN